MRFGCTDPARGTEAHYLPWGSALIGYIPPPNINNGPCPATNSISEIHLRTDEEDQDKAGLTWGPRRATVRYCTAVAPAQFLKFSATAS